MAQQELAGFNAHWSCKRGWDKLARFLIVKHNDQTMQPSENGVFVRGRSTPPAYAPAFIDAVKAQTGDRYVKPAEKK